MEKKTKQIPKNPSHTVTLMRPPHTRLIPPAVPSLRSQERPHTVGLGGTQCCTSLTNPKIRSCGDQRRKKTKMQMYPLTKNALKTLAAINICFVRAIKDLDIIASTHPGNSPSSCDFSGWSCTSFHGTVISPTDTYPEPHQSIPVLAEQHP